jgi:hypothetical protein
MICTIMVAVQEKDLLQCTNTIYKTAAQQKLKYHDSTQNELQRFQSCAKFRVVKDLIACVWRTDQSFRSVDQSKC